MAGNTVPRMADAREGMNALDLLVVARPASHHLSRLSTSARTTPTCCPYAPSSSAPAAARPRTVRCSGARRSSIRSFESDNDLRGDVSSRGKKLGFAEEMFKPYEMVQGKFSQEPTAESIPARDQSRRLVGRLYGSESRAAQGAYGQPGQVRSGQSARARRC